MIFKVKILAILLLGISWASGSDNTEFLTSFQTFNQDLFSQMVKSNGNKNIIYSPFSIQTCLAMTRMGADGQTAMEMDQGLSFTGQTPESVAQNYFTLLAKYEKSDILTIANKVYVKEGSKLQDNYNELLSDKFFSSAESIDFAQSGQAARTINTWVETKTNDKIKDLVSADSLNADTRLVLLNAVYFNGKWDTAFNKEATSERDFFINESDSVKVPMMSRIGKCEVHRSNGLDGSILRLPYKDSDLSMLVFLPFTRSGLSELEKQLENFDFKSLGKIHHVPNCNIRLPKFKTEFEIELKDTLKEMGMRHIFGDADLSKMMEASNGLYVSKVLHKAVIEVAEEGTVAAAATAAVTIFRTGPFVFEANYPFVYAIVNEDYVPMFQGVVVQP